MDRKKYRFSLFASNLKRSILSNDTSTNALKGIASFLLIVLSMSRGNLFFLNMIWLCTLGGILVYLAPDNNDRKKTVIDLYYSSQYNNIFVFLFTYIAVFVPCIIIFLILSGDPSFVYHSFYYSTNSLIILNILRVSIIHHRVARNFFGFNLHEAKQIIKFIRNNEDMMPPPGGGSRKIFNFNSNLYGLDFINLGQAAEELLGDDYE